MITSVETFALQKKVGDIRTLELCAEAGLGGIDYSFYWLPADHPMMGENFLAYADELKKTMDGLGLVCHQAHAPFDMVFGDVFDESGEHFRGIVRAMEAAKRMGAERIVVHAVKIPPEHGRINLIDYNVEFYRALVPYCQRFDIKVAVENLFTTDRKCQCYRSVLGSPEDVCAVLRRVGSPYLVACLDIGHAALTGVEPELFIRRMDPGTLAALHIQDNDYRRDAHVLPFGGLLDWNAILSALKDVNYRGDVSFEIYGFLSPLPEELLPAALRYVASVGDYLAKRI
jgi:sugar phosphate isomerase/epimerase